MWTFWQASVVNPCTVLVMILNQLSSVSSGKHNCKEVFKDNFSPNLSQTRGATTVFCYFINMKFPLSLPHYSHDSNSQQKPFYYDELKDLAMETASAKQRQQKKTRQIKIVGNNFLIYLKVVKKS